MKKSEIFYGWWVVLGCIIIMAFPSPMVTSLGSLYVKPISAELKVSRSTYLVTSSLISIGTIISSPLLGRLLTKKDLKKVMILSNLLMAVSFASYSLAQNVISLYIPSIFMGLATMSSGMISTSIIVTNWFEKKRGLAMSLIMAGLGIGGSLLSPLITYLIINYGWRTSRVIVAILHILVVLPTIHFIIKVDPEEMGLKPYGSIEEQNDNNNEEKLPAEYEAAISEQLQIDKATLVTDVPLNISKKKSYYYLILIAAFFIGVANFGGMNNINPYTSDIHGTVFAGTIVSIYSFSSIPGKIALGFLHDKFGSMYSLFFGGIMLLVSFLMLAFLGNSITLMVVMAFMFGIGNSIGSVNINLITASIFGTKNYSTILGIIKSMQQLGGSIGPLIISLIYETTGGYKIGWIFCAIITVASVVSFYISYKVSIKDKIKNI